MWVRHPRGPQKLGNATPPSTPMERRCSASHGRGPRNPSAGANSSIGAPSFEPRLLLTMPYTIVSGSLGWGEKHTRTASQPHRGEGNEEEAPGEETRDVGASRQRRRRGAPRHDLQLSIYLEREGGCLRGGTGGRRGGRPRN